jgi:hypothetical protein
MTGDDLIGWVCSKMKRSPTRIVVTPKVHGWLAVEEDDGPSTLYLGVKLRADAARAFPGIPIEYSEEWPLG